MEITSKHRALDKIYKRRDRYEIPDWQRGEVWDTRKKQDLIDSILRGWKLPKFYFLRTGDEPEEFEVVDGQQRLTAIFEFFDDELELSPASASAFGGILYKNLPEVTSDAFDDFEIEYDEIVDAEEEEIKQFFQRLQQGLPLTASEKLNAVHSNLRDFCSKVARHEFFARSVAFADKRYTHFDVAAKAAAIEIEGVDTGLRFDDLRETFGAQKSFSDKSATASRLTATLDFLARAFPDRESRLRNRAIVQSVITLASRLVATGRAAGHEARFRVFVVGFVDELSRQVELGIGATDPDYVLFQRSVSANVKNSVRIRHEVLLRKLLRTDAILGEVFDPAVVAESGLSADISRLGDSIGDVVTKTNAAYAAKHGKDLFKPTNKTLGALRRLGTVITDYKQYKAFVDDLYFLFWEGPGTRLGAAAPASFTDIRDLRTDVDHDVDHGKDKEVAAKRRKLGEVFVKYAGSATPTTIAPERFPVVQVALLKAVEADLRTLAGTI
jgi:hypothetical protein